MRITKVKIQNFRSFDDGINEVYFKEDIQKPFSIVGNNNSGKSNLIRALKLALELDSSKKISKNDFYYEQFEKDLNIQLDFKEAIKLPDAYNSFHEWEKCDLKSKFEAGEINTTNYCCKKDGKSIFATKQIRRSPKKEFTDEEKGILNDNLKKVLKQYTTIKVKLKILYIL
jgi:predicted ATP-dependent endonuclease of OLD family